MTEPSRNPQTNSQPRPFLGVHARCCNAYLRAYENAQGDAFVGWCPKCAAPVRIRISNEGGSTSRFFGMS